MLFYLVYTILCVFAISSREYTDWNQWKWNGMCVLLIYATKHIGVCSRFILLIIFSLFFPAVCSVCMCTTCHHALHTLNERNRMITWITGMCVFDDATPYCKTIFESNSAKRYDFCLSSSFSSLDSPSSFSRTHNALCVRMTHKRNNNTIYITQYLSLNYEFGLSGACAYGSCRKNRKEAVTRKIWRRRELRKRRQQMRIFKSFIYTQSHTHT